MRLLFSTSGFVCYFLRSEKNKVSIILYLLFSLDKDLLKIQLTLKNDLNKVFLINLRNKLMITRENKLIYDPKKRPSFSKRRQRK